MYLRKDVETVLRIKNLLYEEKYTIAGVRKRIGGHGPNARNLTPRQRLEKVKEGLRAIARRLEKPL